MKINQNTLIQETGTSLNSIANGIIIESGTGYIKYSNGIMVCYGSGNGLNSSYGTITFPVPFKVIPYCIANAVNNYLDMMIISKIIEISTTQLKVAIYYANKSSSSSFNIGGDTFNYIAIGTWK